VHADRVNRGTKQLRFTTVMFDLKGLTFGDGSTVHTVRDDAVKNGSARP